MRVLPPDLGFEQARRDEAEQSLARDDPEGPALEAVEEVRAEGAPVDLRAGSSKVQTTLPFPEFRLAKFSKTFLKRSARMVFRTARCVGPQSLPVYGEAGEQREKTAHGIEQRVLEVDVQRAVQLQGLRFVDQKYPPRVFHREAVRQ